MTVNITSIDVGSAPDAGDGDPARTAFTSCNTNFTNLKTALDNADINAQTGTTYTILASDAGKVLTFNNAAAIAVTLPDGLATNFHCTIVQIGAGVPTVTPATDTVNGAGTGVAPSAQWAAMYLAKFSATEWMAIL